MSPTREHRQLWISLIALLLIGGLAVGLTWQSKLPSEPTTDGELLELTDSFEVGSDSPVPQGPSSSLLPLNDPRALVPSWRRRLIADRAPYHPGWRASADPHFTRAPPRA